MEKEPKQSGIRVLLENLFYIGVAIVLASTIQSFIIRPFIVSGNSMDPNIEDKQYLMIEEVSYRFHQPQRGDVIVFKAPPEPTKFYIKRIIGLPGETVKIQGGAVSIINDQYPNGFALAEPYVTHTASNTMEMKVPAGQYFVMGDNRSGSYDSRSWGPLPKEDIRGRSFLRLLPLQKIAYLPGKEAYGQKN